MRILLLLLASPLVPAPTVETGSRECTYHDVVCTLSPACWFSWKFTIGDCSTITFDMAHIGDDGAIALASSLRDNAQVQYLKLRGSLMGDPGAKALADAVPTMLSLHSLELRGSHIGPEGATALASAITGNSVLTMLDVRNNALGPAGARVFADMLKKNNALAILNLSGNRIGGDGAVALAEGLKANDALRTLELKHNQIDASGAAALLAALTFNQHLTKLDLENNVGADAAIRRDIFDTLALRKPPPPPPPPSPPPHPPSPPSPPPPPSPLPLSPPPPSPPNPPSSPPPGLISWAESRGLAWAEFGPILRDHFEVGSISGLRGMKHFALHDYGDADEPDFSREQKKRLHAAVEATEDAEIARLAGEHLAAAKDELRLRARQLAADERL